MAQIIECDRCGQQQLGSIIEPNLNYQIQGMGIGMGMGYTPQERTPTVNGWRLVDSKLLCDSCTADLGEWLKPLPRCAP